MRGVDHQQSQMFSYMSPETRVRKDHPLRAIRFMVDEVLVQLSRALRRARESNPGIRRNKRHGRSRALGNCFLCVPLCLLW